MSVPLIGWFAISVLSCIGWVGVLVLGRELRRKENLLCVSEARFLDAKREAETAKKNADLNSGLLARTWREKKDAEHQWRFWDGAYSRLCEAIDAAGFDITRPNEDPRDFVLVKKTRKRK